MLKFCPGQFMNASGFQIAGLRYQHIFLIIWWRFLKLSGVAMSFYLRNKRPVAIAFSNLFKTKLPMEFLLRELEWRQMHSREILVLKQECSYKQNGGKQQYFVFGIKWRKKCILIYFYLQFFFFFYSVGLIYCVDSLFVILNGLGLPHCRDIKTRFKLEPHPGFLS